MKDRFSTHSDAYRNFRPDYPAQILKDILEYVPRREMAWDCATGTGQMAAQLANIFDRVEATDISASQLAEAVSHPHIHYAQSPAEQTPFLNQSFDLITVAQGVHWFDFERFYAEVKRVLKADGVLALIGYGLNTVTPEVDAWVREFYADTLGPFWDPERLHIESMLQSIPFPLQEIPMPGYESVVTWSLDAFIGYLGTWSALKKCVASGMADPLPPLKAQLEKHWQGELPVRIPFFVRVGKLKQG